MSSGHIILLMGMTSLTWLAEGYNLWSSYLTLFIVFLCKIILKKF